MVSALILLTLATAPEVALLSSRGDTAELRFQPLGARELVAPAVRFTHAEGSDVFGALLPGSRVVVATATLRERRDLSFASALLRLEAGKPARVLADEVVYGTRPLVTAEGRVFVARGAPGIDPVDGHDALRIDALSVEEIHPHTGARRVVYTARGFATFLAGALGRELIIYEVAPAGARLIGVHVDTLAVREVYRLPAPLGFDFGVDAPRRRVLFTQGLPGADAFSVVSVDLSSGAVTRLAEGPEVALLPTVLADGRVLISAGPGRGLRGVDGGRGLPSTGSGYERVRLQQAGLVLGLHERPSDFPSVFAWRDGQRVPLATPPDSRLDLAGVRP